MWYNLFMKSTETVESLFARATSGYPDPTSCWVWQLSQSGKRCGSTFFQGRTTYAHRVSYLLCVGPIPDGQQIHHTCGQPLCVNPAHLLAVTREEHCRIDPKYARKNITACPHGHAYTPENTKRGQQQDPTNGATYFRRSCRTCHRAGEKRRREALAALLRNPTIAKKLASIRRSPKGSLKGTGRPGR